MDKNSDVGTIWFFVEDLGDCMYIAEPEDWDMADGPPLA